MIHIHVERDSIRDSVKHVAIELDDEIRPLIIKLLRAIINKIAGKMTVMP